MKVKAPSLLKKIITALSSKTNELRIRFMIFFLLHKNIDKNALSQKLHALVAHHPQHHLKKKHDDQHLIENEAEDHEQEEDEDEEDCKADLLMSYNKAYHTESVVEDAHMEFLEDEEREEYPDLTSELLKESEEAMEEEEWETVIDAESGAEGSVVNNNEVTEEDIDQAADLFIKRFKRQIQLQKLHSFDRHQRLLVSNA